MATNRVCPVCGAEGGSCNTQMRAIANRGVTVIREKPVKEGVDMQYRSKQTYWLTADKTEAVPDGDERAHSLLVRAGSPIDPHAAEHFGIDYEPVPNTLVGTRPELGTSPAPLGETPEQEAARLHIEATRSISREVAEATAHAGDAGTGRQIQAVIENRVAGELKEREGESESTRLAPNVRSQIIGDPAQAARDFERGSLSGEELLVENQMGGKNPRRSDQKAEAGANPTGEGAGTGAGATESAGASVNNTPATSTLQPGTQEYAPGTGEAITPAGTERATKEERIAEAQTSAGAPLHNPEPPK